MDYHQNARLTVHSREHLAKKVLEQGLTLKLAAASFNVSAKTAAKWVRRYREQGVAGLRDRSSRPIRCRRQTPEALIEQVLSLRRLRWNGWRIALQLRLSRATVSRVLRRNGMNRLRSLDPPPPVVRYERKRPGDMVHFDIKRLARIVKPGHRVHGDRTRQTRGAGYEYLHIAIDDHSRISFAAILPDQTHASAIRFFHMARATSRASASQSAACLPTTALVIAITSSDAPCGWPRSSTTSPASTVPKPTEKQNASSRPRCASGLTRTPIKTQTKDSNSSNPGCMSTTSTDPMPASTSTHQPPAPASIGTTS